jgi:RNA binding exosome subunit
MESVKYVEEAAYSKLVKHLKNKIRIFDTPLENQPEFLIFMKVTLKMLREKSIEMYGHIINELIMARSKYIELSFSEKMKFIYHNDKQKKQAQNERISNAKNVAQTIAWLHETLINEL